MSNADWVGPEHRSEFGRIPRRGSPVPAAPAPPSARHLDHAPCNAVADGLLEVWNGPLMWRDWRDWRDRANALQCRDSIDRVIAAGEAARAAPFVAVQHRPACAPSRSNPLGQCAADCPHKPVRVPWRDFLFG